MCLDCGRKLEYLGGTHTHKERTQKGVAPLLWGDVSKKLLLRLIKTHLRSKIKVDSHQKLQTRLWALSLPAPLANVRAALQSSTHHYLFISTTRIIVKSNMCTFDSPDLAHGWQLQRVVTRYLSFFCILLPGIIFFYVTTDEQEQHYSRKRNY